MHTFRSRKVSDEEALRGKKETKNLNQEEQRNAPSQHYRDLWRSRRKKDLYSLVYTLFLQQTKLDENPPVQDCCRPRTGNCEGKE